MNSINSNNYNPNFTAIKVDISKVTKNKKRWKNIARIIEEKTAKFKELDIVNIHSINRGRGIYIDVDTFTKSKRGWQHQIEATGKQHEFMMSKSDHHIAGKILKFDRLSRKQDATYNSLNNFLRKIKNKDEDFAQKITDVVVDKVVNTQKEIIENDKFLSKINCYL